MHDHIELTEIQIDSDEEDAQFVVQQNRHNSCWNRFKNRKYTLISFLLTFNRVRPCAVCQNEKQTFNC
jgi:hypothetical protein